MSTFKEIAFQILQETGKPLHSKEITAIALERGWLKTAGKTPEATMNAQLIVDINEKKQTNKWDDHLIDKRDLANQILAQMKRII